jgi:hypothetical protein
MCCGLTSGVAERCCELMLQSNTDDNRLLQCSALQKVCSISNVAAAQHQAHHHNQTMIQLQQEQSNQRSGTCIIALPAAPGAV